MLKIALLLCLAVIAIPILFLVVLNNLPAPQFSTIESPDKTYTVNLRGRKSSPRYWFLMHSVYFDLHRRGEQVVRRQLLHDGDRFDPGFEDLYPDHTWLNNSTLLFHDGKMADQPDTLTIINEASQPIKFLQVKINSVELFLLFDLDRQARATVPFLPQRDEGSLTIEGEFEDGTRLNWTRVSYYVFPGDKRPYKEEIAINDDALTVRPPWSP